MILSDTRFWIVLGAFGGAAFSVFSYNRKKHSVVIMLVNFLMSFVAGNVASHFVAGFLSAITPVNVVAEAPLGALVASSIAVKILTAVGNNIHTITGRKKDL